MSTNNIHVDSLTVVHTPPIQEVTVRNLVFPSRSVFVDNTQYSSVITKSNYPATQLIKLLIQYIGQDLCSFKYFSDVSFNILKTSQNIWFGINQLIQDISRLEKDEDAWVKYTTYTGAIDPLEEFLFEFSLLTEQQTMLYRQFEEFIGINECMTLITIFRTQRDQLLHTVKSLKSSEMYMNVCGSNGWTDKEAHCVSVVCRHSDISFLSLFLERIKKCLGKAPAGVRDIVMKCHHELTVVFEIFRTEFSGNRIDESFVFITIHSAIVIYSTLEMCSRPKEYPEWCVEAKLKTVWQTTIRFLEVLVKQLKTEIPNYKVVEEVFIIITQCFDVDYVPLPGPSGPIMDPPRGLKSYEISVSFTQLLKQVSFVRRPYHAQSLALVSVCYKLWRSFHSHEHHHRDSVVAINEAFQETLTSLQAAATAILDIVVFSFEVDNAEVKKIRQSLSLAQLKIKHCFERFGLHDWASCEIKIKKALEDDKLRMKQLKEFLAKPGHEVSPDVKTSELIEVLVDIHLKARHLEQRTMLVKPSARLFSIMWEASQELKSDHKINCADSCNSKFRDEKNRELPMDALLSSMGTHSKKLRLRLFLGETV